MPLSAKYTEAFPDAQTMMESAYQAIVNDKADVEKTLQTTAEQLQNSTGIEMAK